MDSRSVGFTSDLGDHTDAPVSELMLIFYSNMGCVHVSIIKSDLMHSKEMYIGQSAFYIGKDFA